MKKIYLLLAVLLPFILNSSLAFEIKPYKTTYLAGETFQAEITGNFTRDLEIGNIHFYKNDIEQFPAFFFIKISSKQYFVYFDLQSEGNYSLQVRNALYYEDGLKGDTKKSDFKVEKSFISEYVYSENQVKQSWPSSIEENAYALIALNYSTLSIQGKVALLAKGNGECWPSSSCKVKDTAIALYALVKTGNKDIDSKWLVDAQNNLDIGLWTLVVNSESDSQCNLSTGNTNTSVFVAGGENSLDLDLKNKANELLIRISCPFGLTSKLVHTYLGKTTEYQMNKQGNSFSLVLNNSKCYGKGYRDSCDVESSAYALLALDALKLDKQDLVNWLKTNAATTKEKAISNKFSSFEDWLENNQHNRGYWSNSSLAISQIPDTESTIFASWALNDEKGKNWIKENIANFNFKNKALALAFLFPYSDVENIVSINPAFIKPGQKVEISAKNNGIKNLNISAKFLLNKQTRNIFLEPGQSSKISFDIVNTSIISSSIELSYPEKSGDSELQYTIPVMLLQVEGNETILIEIPENRTGISKDFKFLTGQLNFSNLTLLSGQEITLKIFIKDMSFYPVKNLTLSYTRDFAKILTIEPITIDEIDGGSARQVDLAFIPLKEGKYNGYIEAKSFNISVRLPINLAVTKNASQVNIPNSTVVAANKTCKAYNGTICKNDEKCSLPFKHAVEARCCTGSCSKASQEKKPIGLALIGLAAIILIIFLLSRLRKPKKPGEMKSYIEKVEEKYNRKLLKKDQQV